MPRHFGAQRWQRYLGNDQWASEGAAAGPGRFVRVPGLSQRGGLRQNSQEDLPDREKEPHLPRLRYQTSV